MSSSLPGSGRELPRAAVRPAGPTIAPAPAPVAPPYRQRLLNATAAARDFHLSLQKSDGHWCAELEGDTILESEYILLMYYIGRGQHPKARKAANYILRKQMPGGGWSNYPGGPPEVSASVKNYFALKLVGEPAESEHMVRARDVIRRLGGVDATNSFTKAYLAIFGQYPWERCPAVPPEIILLPNWVYFNSYEMSSLL